MAEGVIIACIKMQAIMLIILISQSVLIWKYDLQIIINSMNKSYIRRIWKSFIWFSIILISSNCHKEEKALFQDSLVKSTRRIELKHLQIDTIQLDKIESSYLGSIDIYNDSIFFIDKRFCWVFAFDKNGKYNTCHLGRGKGLFELNTPKISAFERLNNGDYIFITTSNDCHIHDQNFQRKEIYKMSKAYKKIQYMHIEDIDPSMEWIYTLSYKKLVVRSHNGYVYFNLYSGHPSFNFISTPERYFEDCRLLAKMNIDDGVIEEMFGRFSPVYKENENLKQFSLISFDISNSGDFYICLEADSLIYKYNNKFRLKAAFGFEGREMDQDYSTVNSFQQLNRIGRSDREEKGFYDWVEYIDEKDLLFRSYKKGKENPTDGLQIYDDQVMIADVDVPKNFRVIGYIKPFVYSEAIIDEDEEVITIYRFKI